MLLMCPGKLVKTRT